MKLEVSANVDFKRFLNPELAVDAVKKVVKFHTADLEKRANRKVPVDTGHLKRSISAEFSEDGMTGTTGATAEYAGYVEKGTRFMGPRPYLGPSMNEVKPGFLADIERIAEAGGKHDQ